MTESALIDDVVTAKAIISELRQGGIKVSLDDFGTGYSSLRYLLQYRFDALKVDRSFISGLPADERQDAVVQAIIAMARALEAEVVAEGVETVGQAERLEMHGCHELQGHYYSYPLEADGFAMLLTRDAMLPRGE